MRLLHITTGITVCVMGVGALCLLSGCPCIEDWGAAREAIWLDDGDNGGSFLLLTGGKVYIKLPAQAGTGYFWHLASSDLPDNFTLDNMRTIPGRSGLVGESYTTEFELEAEYSGTSEITIGLYAPDADIHAGDTPEETFQATITAVGCGDGRVVVRFDGEDDDEDPESHSELRITHVGSSILVKLLAAEGQLEWRILDEGAPASEAVANTGGFSGSYQQFWFDAVAAGVSSIRLGLFDLASNSTEPLSVFNAVTVVRERAVAE